jgi:hypothetical protein
MIAVRAASRNVTQSRRSGASGPTRYSRSRGVHWRRTRSRRCNSWRRPFLLRPSDCETECVHQFGVSPPETSGCLARNRPDPARPRPVQCHSTDNPCCARTEQGARVISKLHPRRDPCPPQERHRCGEEHPAEHDVTTVAHANETERDHGRAHGVHEACSPSAAAHEDLGTCAPPGHHPVDSTLARDDLRPHTRRYEMVVSSDSNWPAFHRRQCLASGRWIRTCLSRSSGPNAVSTR